MTPWHSGWPWIYFPAVVVVAPHLSAGDLLGCLALGAYVWAGLRLRQEARA